MSELAPLDLERRARVGVPRRLVALLAAAVIIAAWWQVLADPAGTRVSTLERDGVPVDVLVAPGAVDAPGVVVAHGFSGSRQLMRSTALALAEAGFAVAVPDLSGHGANRRPLPTDGRDQLTRDVLAAADVLGDTEGVRAGPVGLLGHSMGSGAVMSAGLAAPERVAAVVAVSPTDAEVTPELPNDLLLLAGEREPRFVTNARDLLERAGGPTAGGEGTPRRDLAVIDGVEHVSILFSPEMYDRSIAWFAASFDLDAAPVRRGLPPIGWWALHLLAVVALWRCLVPVLVDPAEARHAPGRGVVGAGLGALAATVVLAAVGAAVELDGLGGMLVAPVLAVWLLLAGGVWLWFGPRPPAPDGRDLGWAVVLVLVLTAALPALGSRVWLPALPGGSRAVLLVVFVALVLPWSMALATTLHGSRGWRAAGWWVLLALVTTAGFAVAASVIPGLGFLVLLLPLIPVLLTVAVAVWLPVQRPWAAGTATAVLLGWMLAILFPLA
jgi:dienelactone hydrolase